MVGQIKQGFSLYINGTVPDEVYIRNTITCMHHKCLQPSDCMGRSRSNLHEQEIGQVRYG